MSRHDKVIEFATDVRTRCARGSETHHALYTLITALKEEIAAHDKTREQRTEANKYNSQLLGNVRGLEAKIARLSECAAPPREPTRIVPFEVDGYVAMPALAPDLKQILLDDPQRRVLEIVASCPSGVKLCPGEREPAAWLFDFGLIARNVRHPEFMKISEAGEMYLRLVPRLRLDPR